MTTIAEQVYEDMPPVPGMRVELLDGRIVMSPPPPTNHNVVVWQLVQALVDVADQHDWGLLQTQAVHIAATRERPQPDLVVAPPDAPEYDDHELYGHGIALVAQVVSPRSRHEDFEYKAKVYALGDVPMYLVIDAIAEVPDRHAAQRPDGPRLRLIGTDPAGEAACPSRAVRHHC